MADKQFARSGPAEFEPLADDDPLSELARIVGYDARPAVQQLQELQRHQEAMRREPAFDLEEELLRAFDSYDTPHAAPVRPDSGLVEHPSAAVPTDGPHSVFDEQAAQNAVVADVAPAPEEVAEAAALPSIETPVEWTSNGDLAAVAAPHDEPAVDLERELELSLGYDASPDATDAAQPGSVPADVSDVPIFSDWQEPLSAKLAVAGKLAEQAGLAEPVYVDMAGDLAGAVESDELADIAVAPPELPSQPSASTGADRLLTDVERFPVPAAAEAAAPAVAETQDRPAPAAVKKNNYPFTPTFSRATPVASSGGVSQQRAFATPTVETAVASAAATSPAVVAQSVSPERAPEMRAEAAPQIPENRMPEAVVEPSFDIEDFELELADIALDLDLADSPVAEAPASVVATQAAVAHPALVETPAQPYLQAMAAPREPETFVHQAPVSARDMSVPVEPEKPSADVALPFDPAMIGETESGVAPIGELDVPQLPPVETEEKAAAYPADYDLDIDAEMAQLFSAPTPAAKNGADLEPVSVSADKAGPALAPADDFDEFEKAMEEDFQRSMAERRSATQEAERVTAMPHARAEEYREEGYGRRSQRSMLLAASVAGIIIVGGAAVYAWMGGSNAVLSGDGPKIILADKAPVKVVPEEKGGKTVPNQDKAVYDRVAGVSGKAPLQQSLVSSTEEPMDVVQRTLTPETLPLEGRGDVEMLPGASPADDDEVARLLPGADAGNATDEEEAVPAVAPRKVRTMIVKPDGTLVPREEPAPQPESAAVAAGGAAPIPARASGEAVAAGSQAEATAAAPPDQLAAASEGVTPVRSVKTTALPQARPAAQPEAAAPAAAPAESQPATETAAAPLATASVPAGSYVIQIASLPSEAEAQKSYNNLSSKFASVIGGRGVDIRKAEIAGKGTYYRVRIPVGSREEANSLCSRYKSAGGSCLVTK
ncbi:SPOR domain-containing protein [Sinorhizobium meliloti]|uniref:SPOR domain-containing protein n=1 Tax=Rhizobium meliloti TaxID=382 RepID=UPI000FD8F50C|nr:SPOR domain-containing protein [Sinorhizobium meliloti]MDW9473934.1 SPOR domain-containing protein [Sinorhizobium meliloti]RVP24610.1 SPOR domain-containing protein [Sinorhizobium meliloti]RVP24644.1 SPOR domain-containing protein [Sinorhizobium meliloti]